MPLAPHWYGIVLALGIVLTKQIGSMMEPHIEAAQDCAGMEIKSTLIQQVFAKVCHSKVQNTTKIPVTSFITEIALRQKRGTNCESNVD